MSHLRALRRGFTTGAKRFARCALRGVRARCSRILAWHMPEYHI